MSKFPQIVYKAPGPIVRARYTYSQVTVINQAQLDQRLASGWHTSLAEAVEAAGPKAQRVSRVRPKPPRKPSQPFTRVRPKKPAPIEAVKIAAVEEPVAVAETVAESFAIEDNMPPTREELAQKATELGLKFDGRTSVKKLRQMIEAAVSEGA